MTDITLIQDLFNEAVNILGNNRIMNDEFPEDLVQDKMCDIASKYGVDLDEAVGEDFDLTDFIIDELTEKELM